MNWPFRSTAEGVVLAAVGLNRVCGHTGEFDSRFMGFWYGLIFCIGFFLLQMLYGDFPATVSTLALCAWIAASCSAVYVPWFNTFYFDALTLAALTAPLVGVGRVVLQNRVGALTLLSAACWLALIAVERMPFFPLCSIGFFRHLRSRSGFWRQPKSRLRGPFTRVNMRSKRTVRTPIRERELSSRSGSALSTLSGFISGILWRRGMWPRSIWTNLRLDLTRRRPSGCVSDLYPGCH